MPKKIKQWQALVFIYKYKDFNVFFQNYKKL